MDGARQGAGAQPERGGTAVQRLSPPPVHHPQGHGRTHNIVCPLHRWTYDTSGRLLGAPHFRATPAWTWKRHLWPSGTACCSPVRAIRIWICRNWRAADLDFSGYVLDRVMIEEYPVNWKTFIEVYLEDYHIGPFHPGLGQFVDAENLKWEFGEWYSVQTVGIIRRSGGQARMHTRNGTRRCFATTMARCPSRAQSGSLTIRTSW